MTNKGVIDADTVARSCCGNWSGAAVPVEQREADGRARRGALPDGFPGYSAGHCDDAECLQTDEEERRLCRVVRSGGSLNTAALAPPGDFRKLGDWSSSGLCRASSSPSWPAQGCELCSMANLCYPQDAPPPGAAVLPGAAWAPYLVEAARGRAGNLVGADAQGLLPAFVDRGSGAAAASRLRYSWDSNRLLCKFDKRDWRAWLAGLKHYYRVWAAHYSAQGPRRRLELAPPEGARGKDFENYMLANPSALTYLENEVNLYVAPRHGSQASGAEAEAQTRMLRDAVRGFFYVDKTCLELLAPLEGTRTAVEWSQGAPKSFSTARARCLGYVCEDAAEGWRRTDPLCERLVDDERAYLDEAARQVFDLTRRFNETYRAQAGQRHISAFRFVGQSNSFYEFRTLQKLAAGSYLSPTDYFLDGHRPL